MLWTSVCTKFQVVFGHIRVKMENDTPMGTVNGDLYDCNFWNVYLILSDIWDGNLRVELLDGNIVI